MSNPVVKYERKGRIVHLRLCRPERLNAVNQQLVNELLDALYRLDGEDESWVAILSGEGRAFCSGADVVDRIAGTEARGFSRSPTVNVMLSKFKNYKPVITAVHGWAVGAGVGFTLQSDLVVADETAKFQIAEVSRGIDGTVLWAPLSVKTDGSFADDLCITGRVVDAAEAERRGLVNRLVPAGQHIAGAEELAEQLLANPPLAVRAMVRTRRTHMELVQAKAHIQTRESTLPLTEDFRESVAALREKRKPVFHAR